MSILSVHVNTVNKNACLGHAVTKRYTALLDEVYKQLSLQSVSDGKNAVWHDILSNNSHNLCSNQCQNRGKLKYCIATRERRGELKSAAVK